MAWRSGSGASHSRLTMRQRRTPTKICRKVNAKASVSQPALTRSRRAARSAKLALRGARYSSAAETRILIAEDRIRRISPAFARFWDVERGLDPRWYRRLGMVLGPILQ